MKEFEDFTENNVNGITLLHLIQKVPLTTLGISMLTDNTFFTSKSTT